MLEGVLKWRSKGGGEIGKVLVCDALMGSGKTSAAMRKMADGGKYLYITPFLSEVQRVAERLGFAEPEMRNGHGKFDDLKYLLRRGKSVASTHALLKKYDDEVAELLRQGGYTLVLDEVLNVLDKVAVGQTDVRMLRQVGAISVAEGGSVRWEWGDYGKDGLFAQLRNTIDGCNVLASGDNLLLWLFPVGLFAALRETIILTYQFAAQTQRMYFDMFGIEYERIGVAKIDGEYQFCAAEDSVEDRSGLRERVHILQKPKLNEIGDPRYALSMSWFEREGAGGVPRLKKNMYNVMHNIYRASSKDVLWTTYKEQEAALSGRGYAGGFLPFNTRSVNEFGDRHYLLYGANIFMNAGVRSLFRSLGVEVDEEQYALSMMLQWLWRSAIRNGEDIYVYVPSSRMRHLLEDWLSETGA